MPETKEQQSSQLQLQLKFERSEDFAAVYANNVTVQSTVWDLNLTFGQIDMARGTVEQHTSVTIPWTVAKVLIYLLQANVVGYEIQNNKIQLVEGMYPQEVNPPTKEIADNPLVQQAYHALVKLRDDFVKYAKE